MKKLFALAVLALFADSAFAQIPQPLPPQQQVPPSRPVISPYLQLLNNTNNPAQNYYNRVLPLQNLNNLQNQVYGLQNTPQQYYPGTGGELNTGKNVGFFTHRQYFMNFGGVNQSLPLTGQYGTAGNNPVYANNNQQQQPQQQQPANNPGIMPFRR